MFSPKLNSSGKSPMNASIRSSSRRGSLYVQKNKAFFTPQSTGRSRNLNASELPLTLSEGGSSEHQLSIFDGFVPVSVCEILLSFDGLSPKAKVSESGLAYLISKDKLFLWNVSSAKTTPCYELHMSYSTSAGELADDLIFVATLDGNDGETSCLAITSEGSAIYWSCIAYSRSLVEINISSGRGASDLCVDLATVAGGFVIGWLSGAMTYLQPSQGQLKQTTLRAQQGGLTGIGRRFSSMIFGSGQRSSTSVQIGSLRRILEGKILDSSSQEMFVLTETHLQKWVVSPTPLGGKMLYEVSLEGFMRNGLDQYYGIQGDSLMMQDIQLTGDGVAVLFSLISRSDVKYGIALVSTSSDEIPTAAVKVVMSEVTSPLLNDGEGTTYKLLWPDKLSTTSCFFYNNDSIICFKDHEDGNVTSEVVNYSNVGAGSYRGLPIFLSAQGGLIKVQETVVAVNQSMADSLMKSKMFSNIDASVLVNASVDRLSELVQSQDPLTKFKAIFISSMRHVSHIKHSKITALLSELFAPSHITCDLEPKLDSLVVRLSQEMIDDYPSNDPRWAESKMSEITVVSTSLILTHQLNDKLKAHEAFIGFLKANNLWDRLGAVLGKDGYMSTCQILCEHAEKLVAAMTFREIHVEYPNIVDSAIDRCVSKRRSLASLGSLKPQDLYYREVSKIQEIFEHLVTVERCYLDSVNIADNPDVVKYVSGVGIICKEVLGKVLSFRSSKLENVYKNSNLEQKSSSNHKIASPWTATDVVLGSLYKQHSMLTSEVITQVNEGSHRNILFQDLLEITDLILNGLTSILDCLTDSDETQKEEMIKKYEHTRSDLFTPFVEFEQYERVMSLGEKYCDYEILVELCDKLHDEARLQEYMTRFEPQGFPEVVFNWYCKTGKRGKLFGSKLMNHPRLEEFLRREENKFMSWLYDVHMKNYTAAHKTLFELAMNEREKVTKKRTLLSTAKLYAYLSKNPPFDVEERINVISNNLELITHQEILMRNPSILHYLAIESFSTSRVYSALELIDLHVGECNTDADEYEFKKAFDLLKFCDANDEDHPIREILIDIWVKAILRDDWNFPLSTTDPIPSCKDTIFFKLLELVLSEVVDVEKVLPSMDELLESQDLDHLKDDVDFRCRLMIIYEHSRRMVV